MRHGVILLFNDAAYGAEVHQYGVRGIGRADRCCIPEVDFAALATAVGAESAVIRTLDDLDRLESWAAESSDTRRFLLLDLRISGDVIAPYRRESSA